jgi:hypothetical protein
MSDLRDPEPPHRTLDMLRKTVGAYKWQVDIDVWPYSGLKNEKVYSRKVTFLLRAESARVAMGLADMLAETIKAAHDVWETRITRVELES